MQMEKCVAVGDMFIHEEDFRRALEKSSLFQTCRYLSWKEDAQRPQARKIIRNIETKGSTAYPPDQVRFWLRKSRMQTLCLSICVRLAGN